MANQSHCAYDGLNFVTFLEVLLRKSSGDAAMRQFKDCTVLTLTSTAPSTGLRNPLHAMIRNPWDPMRIPGPRMTMLQGQTQCPSEQIEEKQALHGLPLVQFRGEAFARWKKRRLSCTETAKT